VSAGPARLMTRKFLVGAVAVLALLAPARPAPAASFDFAPGQVAIGAVASYTTRYEDTLLDVARDHDFGYTQLITANFDIDPWLPGKNRDVVLPSFYILPDAPRRGIVINLAQQRLFYFPPDGKTAETYPIGVGVQGWATPTGTTQVVAKQPHPAWYPPASIRAVEPDLPKVVPAGPNNPLGDYAMFLGWPGYLIHGTNKPYGVGRNVSHGCIRLYPEDIDRLFHEVAIGTPVRVIDQEDEAAWIDGVLYVAVFPDKEQADQIDVGERMTPRLPADLKEYVTAVAGDRVGQVDWQAVTRIGLMRRGIPLPVTKPMKTSAVAAPPGNIEVGVTPPVATPPAK
jgi:L,D-transpeptidase ErfK/SrfK